MKRLQKMILPSKMKKEGLVALPKIQLRSSFEIEIAEPVEVCSFIHPSEV